MTNSSSASQTDSLSTFVDLSVLLTGFAKSVIQPNLDPVDLAGTYFQYVEDHVGPTFQQLLDLYSQLVAQGLDDQQIGEQILGASDPDIGLTAQAINKLWYLGSWYQPFDYKSYTAGSQWVVSSQAYVGGLAWKVMQSHAMGSSTLTFGYWNTDPPPLEDFTGQTSTGQTSSDGSSS